MENRIRGSLKERGVPLPLDFDERLRVLELGLRGKPEFQEEIKKFRGNQAGGQMPEVVPDRDDFLGPQLRWFVEGVTSPYAQMVWKSVFAFIFFISYLETTPVFGNVLSAALDIMVAGGKSLTKTIQTNLPPLFGLLPLPWSSIFGLMLAAVFGMIMWPMLALVSLSRQDFAFAVESFIRIVPPPFGNTVADLFMEANRMVGRLNEKREKLGEDLSNAFNTVGEVVDSFSEKASGQLKQGAENMSKRVAEVSSSDAVTKAKTAVQTAGKALSRRTKSKGKWHRKTQRKSAKH